MKSNLHVHSDAQQTESRQFVRCSVLITTKNRREALSRTLESLIGCLGPDDELIVLDDGSTDGTSDILQSYRHVHHVIRHDESSGLIAARNELLIAARGMYAVVLDDDAEFVVADPFSEIDAAFDRHPDAAALAFPIWWGLEAPVETNAIVERERPVRSWIGCGHAIRLSSWRQIVGYPSWFIFGGEEQHAAMQFFCLGYLVWYVPSVLVHHRVSNAQRRGTSEAWYKYWRSLHSGWCVMLTFYPMPNAARALVSSMVNQLKRRCVKERSVHHCWWLLRALIELWINARRILVERQALSSTEFEQWQKTDEAIVYWTPTSRS